MKLIHSLWPARVGFAAILITELLGITNSIDIEPEFTWKGMIIQAILIWGSVEVAQWLVNRHKLNMSLGLVALIIMLQLTVDAVGDMGHLYGRFTWYDEMLHYAGGFNAALLATGFIKAIHEKRHDGVFPMGEAYVTGFSISVVAQVFYELEEYMEDVLTGSNRLGDGFDTANDLMLGMFGALLGALLVLKLPKLTRKR